MKLTATEGSDYSNTNHNRGFYSIDSRLGTTLKQKNRSAGYPFLADDHTQVNFEKSMGPSLLTEQEEKQSSCP
uniref:Ovule protein n=1 Tax=Steinernema glaseri TaxID=37863 RepID=A0A1I8A9W7_9BILA